jgi:hypothetical protein
MRVTVSRKATLKEWTDILVPWLQVIGLFAAGGFALFQYYGHNQEAKIQRAADYLARLSSGELFDASLELSVQEENLSDRQDMLDDKRLTPDQRNAAYYHFVVCELLMHGKSKNLERNFLMVLGFLDDGVVCSKGLCDKKTIRSNLNIFGQDFVRTYEPYFCYLRMTWKDPAIGEGVEKFYNPSSVGHACRDFEEALRRTEALKGTRYSC